jgi:serine phosphatase RsbU (regulator of sigma subunit)/ligand-binding sensor domain-containing protein
MSEASNLPRSSRFTAEAVLLLAAVLLGITAASLDAQTISFERIPNDGGAPIVTALMQDSAGFLWVGRLRGGLSRYDGETFKTYRWSGNNPQSHNPQDDISALHEDRAGVFWVGTFGGLMRFDRQSEKYSSPETAPLLHDTIVQCIYEDRGGALWAGSSDGLTRLQNGRPSEQYLQGLSIVTVAETRDGALWVGAVDAGLFQFNAEKKSFESRSNGKISVFGIFEDGGGNLWLPGDTLRRYQRSTRRFDDFPQALLNPDGSRTMGGRKLYADPAGRLWLGTIESGVKLFDTGSGQVHSLLNDPRDVHSLSSNNIRSIVADQNGNVWIGTNDGLNRYSPSRAHFETLAKLPNDPHSLRDNFVGSLAQDAGGLIWISTLTGLQAFDPVSRIVNRYDHDERAADATGFDSLYSDAGGTLWRGDPAGRLWRFDRRSGRFIPVAYLAGGALHDGPLNQGAKAEGAVLSILKDRDGVLWVGTSEGVFKKRNPNEPFQPVVLPGSGPHARAIQMLQDRAQRIWITQQRRLFVVDPHTSKAEVVGDASIGEVVVLFLDSHANMWVGSSLGLYAIDAATHRFAQRAHGWINSIEEDGRGRLWFTRDESLVSLDQTTGRFRVFGTVDGLQGHNWRQRAALRDSHSMLYFGGVNGITWFDPASIPNNDLPPRVAITSVELFDKPFPLHGRTSVELPYDQNFLTLQFAALDFSEPEKNQYAYKLEGLDTDWVTAGNHRLARYPALRPGRYVFRVKASNNDGVWNARGASIAVHITPPFWQTLWFRLLEALGVVLVFIAGLLLQRMRLQRKRQEEIRALDLQRNRQELEFARELQLSMLPAASQSVEGFDIAAEMRTATEVGGDYYDYLALPDGRLFVAVGDATGHGVAAGLVVAMVKIALRSSLRTQAGRVNLAQIANDLNAGLRESVTQRSMGMSLLMAVVDREACIAQICSCGMPQPYLIARTGVSQIEGSGPPLGFLKRVEARVSTVPLGDGDTLVFVSDGITERRDRNGDMWGATAPRDVFNARGDRRLSREIVLSLIAACDAFAAGEPHDDDMTVVAVQLRTPSS